ncbi:MAG TPA: hypothetical protein VK995_02400 [Oceanipulchritudo sp.]|nr:hypothetical protein [Oceanipulchritudo sp.]
MATHSGTFRFDYVYSVNHRYFDAAAEFSTFANSSSGEANNLIVDVAEPADDLPVGSFFTGTAEIKVSAGHEFGVNIGGSNFDSISGLNGTMEISNVSFSGPWSNAAYVSGWLDSWFGWIKDVNPQASLIYHLQLGYLYYNGQSSQSVWFYLPSSSFGWTYTSSNFFPYFYMPNKGWFYKYPDSNWFLDLQSQQWVEYVP